MYISLLKVINIFNTEIIINGYPISSILPTGGYVK